MEPIETFADWAADLTIEDLPDDVRRLARAEIAHTVATGAYGAAGAFADRMRLLRTHAGGGSCSAFGTDGVDPASACWINAQCSMIYDFDSFLFMGHSGHSEVFPALAAAEVDEVGFDELVVAVVIANELEGRLGAAAAVGPHNGQMWTFLHKAGAAAVTARMLGDGRRAIADAVQSALYQVPWPTERGFMRGEAKATTAAEPTAAGVRHGLVAASSGRGARDQVFGEGGTLDTYADLPLPEFARGWGDSWTTRSLSFKPRPGCAYLQSPLANLRELCRNEGLAADDVERMRVHASLPTVLMERLAASYRDADRGYSTVEATFSVELGLAAALVGETFDREALSPDFLDGHRNRIGDLADRISVHHDWDHTAALVRGIGEGLDLRALSEERSTFSWLSALRDLRSHHDYASLTTELGTVPNFQQLRDLAESVGPDWGDASFDFGLADFDNLRFDFGATVTVETGDGKLTNESSTFPGSCGESVESRLEGVREITEDVLEEAETDLRAEPFLASVLDDGDDPVEAVSEFVGSIQPT